MSAYIYDLKIKLFIFIVVFTGCGVSHVFFFRSGLSIGIPIRILEEFLKNLKAIWSEFLEQTTVAIEHSRTN